MEGGDYQSNNEPSNNDVGGGGGGDADASAPCCYQRAARALHDADYLLILAGAGMSADSGLGTYETMPSRYREFCDSARLCAAPTSSREEFQAFWHSFALQYASTKPHKGYAILDKWCHGQKLKRLSSSSKRNNLTTNQNQKLSSGGSGGGSSSTNSNDDTTADVADANAAFVNADKNAFIEDHKWWVYTSNVDGHFRRFPSFRCQRRNGDATATASASGGCYSSLNYKNYNNVCEIHGCAGEFRCSCGMGYFDREGFPRMGDLWAQWNEGVEERIRPSPLCKVRTETLEELSERQQQQFASSSSRNNNHQDDNRLPPCKDCGSLPLRPNVLLFNDTDENVLAPIQHHRNRYQEWEARVESSICDPKSTNGNDNLNFVLVELGCGTNVPAVRNESEEVLGDTLDGLLLSSDSPSSETTTETTTSVESERSKGSVTLIRINPKDAGIKDKRLLPHVVSIYETSLRALNNIDKALDSIIVEQQQAL
jgi:NAD-dependent SIR2 family protein deacetylase